MKEKGKEKGKKKGKGNNIRKGWVGKDGEGGSGQGTGRDVSQ